ncbi:hypothetical protein THIOM_000637 [Candidatus Thiomargarita nelsonii]|uniref:Uncharacterized protein n=1 Tax=Candidatus Thiomargarita nelsonii TaxID=1003181 RepID=A0A176S6Q2_9GAMM|nr:hypothetical protein THIOM_000637 [Candidatus Thiomargarita nelsonii]
MENGIIRSVLKSRHNVPLIYFQILLTESTFCAEYDSLSDVVSFRLALALIMHEWSLHSLGKLGS